jgi:hypothetical protein
MVRYGRGRDWSQEVEAMDRKAFLVAAAWGAAAQLALVISGHFVSFIADNLFAIGGMTIAFVAGLIYGRRAPARPFLGGAAAGAAGAFVGILVSNLLGDVPGAVLVLGVLASALTGLCGGAVGAAAIRRKAGS